MSSRLWLPPTDPAGLDRAPAARPMFDPAPHRNRGQPGVALSTREWDNRLIATAVALGMPREDAEQARTYPPARHALLVVWCVVQDAAEGDPRARATVDRWRHAFAGRNQQAVGEALAALEQPADPSELRALMGLD